MSKVPGFLNKIYEKKEYIENLTNVSKNIEYDNSRSFIIRNCKHINYVIDGNVTNLFIENCENINISVSNIFAKIEILRSSGIDIDVLEDSETPITIQLDICYYINIFLNQPSLIQTISCMDIVINEDTLECSMFGDVKKFQLL